jgi:diadenosine tetraphosphate (Ap4A) HIT family hydrolase
MPACPFCERCSGLQGPAAAFDDAFPVTPGHRLVVPAAHVERLEDLDAATWAAVFALVRKEALRAGGDGVTIGVNSGRAAGQTVDHAHVHVIPRRAGDVPDPRGGVRCVVPERRAWW